MSQSAIDASSIEPVFRIPALLTSDIDAATLFRLFNYGASASSAFPTSSVNRMAASTAVRPQPCRRRRRCCLPRIHGNPEQTSVSAIDAPIPPPAPVTHAILPASCKSIFSVPHGSMDGGETENLTRLCSGCRPAIVSLTSARRSCSRTRHCSPPADQARCASCLRGRCGNGRLSSRHH